MKYTIVTATTILLCACSAQSIQKVNDTAEAVQAACKIAVPLAQSAFGIPTVGPYVAAGVIIGCTTNDGIAKLTNDPNSTAWLMQQIQMLKTALHT